MKGCKGLAKRKRCSEKLGVAMSYVHPLNTPVAIQPGFQANMHIPFTIFACASWEGTGEYLASKVPSDVFRYQNISNEFIK